MNWVFGILILFLFILNFIRFLETRRLVGALRATNKALNETRNTVADQEKKIKRLIAVSK